MYEDLEIYIVSAIFIGGLFEIYVGVEDISDI